MYHDPKQHNECGLVLRLRRVTLGDSSENTVTLVEEIQNTSDQPVCFAMRTIDRQILQIASSEVINGKRQLHYLSQPKDFSVVGTDVESDQQVVSDFPSDAGACDGGEVLEPSNTRLYPCDSFRILRAGLYRVKSEWRIDVLDVREAPQYKVLQTCTLRSNLLDVDISADVR